MPTTDASIPDCPIFMVRIPGSRNWKKTHYPPIFGTTRRHTAVLPD
jgi:hypothetical protein